MLSQKRLPVFLSYSPAHSFEMSLILTNLGLTLEDRPGALADIFFCRMLGLKVVVPSTLKPKYSTGPGLGVGKFGAYIFPCAFPQRRKIRDVTQHFGNGGHRPCMAPEKYENFFFKAHTLLCWGFGYDQCYGPLRWKPIVSSCKFTNHAFEYAPDSSERVRKN